MEICGAWTAGLDFADFLLRIWSYGRNQYSWGGEQGSQHAVHKTLKTVRTANIHFFCLHLFLPDTT